MELIYLLSIISVLSAIGCIWGIIQIHKRNQQESNNAA